MNKLTGRNIFLGIILSSNLVVADDIKKIEPGLYANADLTRRVTPPASPASAMEAASATTNGTSHTSVEATPRRLVVAATPASPVQMNEEKNDLRVATGASPTRSGVTELKFNEFFRQPIGPRGLEYTEQLRALDGRRIRILGFMARQTKPVDHCFLLTPVPLTLNEIEYGHADDLPATTLHVLTTEDAPARAPYTPGPLLLTGTLQIGNRLEADGRTSTVRLQLDPPTAEQKAAAHAAAKKVPAHDPHAGHGH